MPVQEPKASTPGSEAKPLLAQVADITRWRIITASRVMPTVNPSPPKIPAPAASPDLAKIFLPIAWRHWCKPQSASCHLLGNAHSTITNRDPQTENPCLIDSSHQVYLKTSENMEIILHFHGASQS